MIVALTDIINHVYSEKHLTKVSKVKLNISHTYTHPCVRKEIPN